MADRFESPLGSTSKRSGSSPPSPVFDLAPRRFMAMARVVCASSEIDPYDMAPVEKRFTISLTGPTSSIGIGLRPSVLSSNSRSEEHTSELQSLMRISYAVFCLKKKKNKTNKV